MNTRLLSRLAVIALLVLLLVSVLTAAAAANTVPSTRLTDQTSAINANALKPAGCAAFDLTAIYICPYATNKKCVATTASELVLARPETNQIDGGGGVNCCVGVSGTKFSNCNWHN